MESYDPKTIEKKWRERWEKAKIYQPDLDAARRPFYNLMMFPYPSAEGLHVGSVFTFTGVDTYGRFKRMQRFDVFEPMGLDGFGIHSENYALKVGRHPKAQAKISEENFYRQLRSIGNGFDWSRKLETYDPAYYKWTQWIFIQLFKKGLAYRKKSPVNFCPSCKTVLADEQVVDGRCERCSSIVEKRDLEQWFFAITKYANRLLANIPKLNWTNKVKVAQENWIGRSEGVLLKFEIRNSKYEIEVFTTALDTIYGATFLVVSPEYPLVSELFKKDKRVMNYLSEILVNKKKPVTEIGKVKTGIPTEYYAVNPFTKEQIPIWIADYVLMGYGTGAIMAVPAHDARDHEFAIKYKLPIRPVIKPAKGVNGANLGKDGFWDYPEIKTKFADKSVLFDSAVFSGLTSRQAKAKMTDFIEQKGIGRRQINFHLRDWLISRQRYWGPPIPLVFCKNCAVKIKNQKEAKLGPSGAKIKIKEFNEGELKNPGWFAIPESQLPVLLPDVKDWKPKGIRSTGSGQAVKSPLANVPSFVNTTCPNCKGRAVRETDVSDTFLDSAWYFFRYISTEFKEQPFDKLRARKWLPVTMYIGGAEHSVLHLLYSRFITMVFKDMGLINFEEPYARFYAHGLIIKEGAKMSKSRGNVINPDEYLAKYGGDTLRAYLRFIGPFDAGGDFRDSGIEGMHRFLKRVWKLVMSAGFVVHGRNNRKDHELITYNPERPRFMHKTIKGVTEDLENLRFNTAVAKIMEFVNHLNRQPEVNSQELEVLLLLIAPFTPFLAEELWQQLLTRGPVYPERSRRVGNPSTLVKQASSVASLVRSTRTTPRFNSVHLHPWPTYDPKMLEEEEVTIVVQINGKVRDVIRNLKLEIRNSKVVEAKAKESKKVKKYIEGKSIKRVIYVPGKIINFVVAD